MRQPGGLQVSLRNVQTNKEQEVAANEVVNIE
jgi:hypothetical protein